MRIALISDIHANLPALDAVLEDIAGRSDVDAVYHLGDLVGYAPWPDEVVDRLEIDSIAGVAGNYDSTVAARYKHCGCRYEDPRQEDLAHRSFTWTCGKVSEVTRRRMSRLPFRLDVRQGGGHRAGSTLILVHATPTINTLYWTADRSESFDRRMIRAAGARDGDVLAFGHTHVPFQRQVDGVRLVNTGSVGRPKDGDPRAGYVIVAGSGAESTVEHIRVEYDVEQTAAGIIASELPDEFAWYLRSGGASLDAPRTGTAPDRSAT